MICDVCKHDAPYTWTQLQRRQQELDRNPTLDIFPCPDCGGRDYMLSEVNLNTEPPRHYDGILSHRDRLHEAAKEALGALDIEKARLQAQLDRLNKPRRSLWYRLTEWWRTLWTRR